MRNLRISYGFVVICCPLRFGAGGFAVSRLGGGLRSELFPLGIELVGYAIFWTAV